MRERVHPEQGFRASIGIIRLARSHGLDRLEAAYGRIGLLSELHLMSSGIPNTTGRDRRAREGDPPAFIY